MDALQDAPIKAPWLFNAETARINARKSVELRKLKAEASVEVKPNAVNDGSSIDPLASKLARVQDELVNQMQGNKDAAEVSKLSRALKDVREVFHLVTGQAKPGVIRETRKPGRQRQAEPEPMPEGDDTSG